MAHIRPASARKRRNQEWQFQLELANQDAKIAADQINIASDQQSIAQQELNIATTQADHAQAVVDFLVQKFTNADLYRWMSGVLGRVYGYFLQQATAMARLAESQLSFERQDRTPAIIQPDYWQPLAGGNGSTGSTAQTPNRGGLRGSERLLEDITKLDQFAFETDQLKLQLTKVISLAQLDPFAFQRFRETGVLRFATPSEVFDRDFPRNYLRVIKQIRTSVIALIPPTQGIRATLANHGISRVVVKDDSDGFQVAVVQREPQLIALSSPSNATGLFELASSQTGSQSGLLLPFEGLAVDTVWEFVLPKASNPFDYTTIADVLLTIDYTALDSRDYRNQVIQQLDQSVSADRSYSFRQQFADAWYELNNSDQSATPMIVHFQTQPEDFPPNVESLVIQHLVMYFVPANGLALPVQPAATLTSMGADPDQNLASVTGKATAVEDVISTRRGNADRWKPAIGMQPVGQWTLDLSHQPDLRNLFQTGQVQDILFVITYNGSLPAWPA